MNEEIGFGNRRLGDRQVGRRQCMGPLEDVKVIVSDESKPRKLGVPGKSLAGSNYRTSLLSFITRLYISEPGVSERKARIWWSIWHSSERAEPTGLLSPIVAFSMYGYNFTRQCAISAVPRGHM